MKTILPTFGLLFVVCSTAQASCSSYTLQIEPLGRDLASTAWTTNLKTLNKTRVETSGTSEIIVCDNQVQVMDALIIGEPGSKFRSILSRDGVVVYSSDNHMVDNVGVGRFGASLLAKNIRLN